MPPYHARLNTKSEYHIKQTKNNFKKMENG